MKNLIILFAVAAVLYLIGSNFYSNQVGSSTHAQEPSGTSSLAATDGSSATTSLNLDTIKELAAKNPIKRTVPEGAIEMKPLIYGDESAPIIIEEFASFTCSHCANFHREKLPKLKEALIDNGIAQLHMYSFVRNAQDLEVTMMIQCQDSNDARKKFTNAVMNGFEQWTGSDNYQDSLKTIARVGGMSEEAFDTCVADTALQDKLIASRQWFDKQVGVNATPYFRVGSEVVKGAQGIAEFETAIQAELAK